MTLLKTAFWASAGLLVYTHAGYPAALAALDRARGARRADVAGAGGDAGPSVSEAELPGVSVIVAAYAEETVIAERVANLRALDYPADKLEVIVACDGSPDATAQRARGAGADVVLELARGGKVRAQDAGVRHARHEITAFSDANAIWEREALRRLVAPFADPQVGYVCGQVRFVNDSGTNQEGLYWRYEMAVRTLESRLASITGGNGAIYATRSHSYIVVDPIMGHDLSFPFNMVKRGWRAVYAPRRAGPEKMVPTIEGEFRRKRRMMSHGWPIMVRGGMLALGSYDPGYRDDRVAPRAALRLPVPARDCAGRARRADRAGLGLCGGPPSCRPGCSRPRWPARAVPSRPLLVARYYVLTTASLAAGLWDWLAHGTHAGWEAAEGTR